MSQKVLIAYGDDEGPRIIGAAEKVLKAAAPDLEILHERIGADAYRNTSYALPPETLDALGECCAFLSGPVDMTGIKERNPLETIKMQAGLLAEYSEIFPVLKTSGNIPMDIGVISPAAADIMDIHETEDLDGVTSGFYTNTEATADLFSIARRLTELRNGTKVWFSDDSRRFPTRNRIVKKTFHEIFDDASFVSVERTSEEISYYLAHDPGSIDIIFCGADSAHQIYGYGAGIIGGGGLMPHAFLSKNFGLFVPMEPFSFEVRERAENPTSAILSVATMLLSMGRREDYRTVRNAVYEMYSIGRTTRDVGGKLNADQFADGVTKIIYSEKLED